MPRSIDPGTLNVGTGLAAEDSVEANALVHPTGGNDGLRVHILDPSRAHEARAIHVVDALNLFASDHVEGALEEIAGSTSAGRVNGLIAGGLFTASSGLTFELDPTTILLGGTAQDFGGQQVVLAASTTQYVYVDTGTGLLTTGGVPALSTEPVLIAEVTTDGVGITSSRDLRFFVFNIDRKISLTVRSAGSGFNQRSEANFITLQAALTYLELYAPGGAVETHTITIRGLISITSTFTIPVPGVMFKGDGEAGFSTGATLAPMFDLNGSSRVTFEDLTFLCNNVGSTAIADTSGHANNLVVRRCRMLTGGSTWGQGISLTDVSTVSSGHIVRDTNIEASVYGIQILRADLCLLENLTMSTGGVNLGTANIAINDTTGLTGTEGRTTVKDCSLTGAATAINLSGDNMVVQNISMANCGIGIQHNAGSNLAVHSANMVLSSVDTAASAQYGIIVLNGDDASITDCTITCPRTVWTAGPATPRGIWLAVTSGTGHTVSNCRVSGFYNDTTLNGSCIEVINATSNIRVLDCVLSDGDTAIAATTSSDDMQVRGCTITNISRGLVLDGARTVVADCNITLNVDRGVVGIQLTSAANTRVRDCYIRNPRTVWPGTSPTGLAFSSGNDGQISGCYIEGFLDTTNALGSGILLAQSDRVRISDTVIKTARFGIEILNTSTEAKIANCDISSVRIGVYMAGSRTLLTNSRITLSAVDGEEGAEYGIWVASAGDNSRITNSEIRNLRVAWLTPGGQDPLGIRVQGNNVLVSGCSIGGFDNATDLTGQAISVQGISNLTVVDTLITGCRYGLVASDTTNHHLTVANNQFDTLNSGVLLIDNIGLDTHTVKVTGNTFVVTLAGPAAVQMSRYRNVEVSGNTFEGSTTAGVGIYVTGVSTTPSDRASGITVTNNNIRAFTGVGIQLTGLVENSTVSGNTINLTLGNNIQVSGTGINISQSGSDAPNTIQANNNTVWNCTQGIRVFGTLATPVTNVNIEGNNIHHIASDTAPADNFGGAGAKAISATLTTGLVIANNQINAVGRMLNNTGSTFAPAVADYSSQGIYLLNCSRASVTGNGVRQVARLGTGTARGIAVRQRGESVDLNTTNFAITGNTIEDTGNTQELILVEVDDSLGGGTQTMTSVAVDGNTTTDGEDAILILLGGDGILRALSVSDNTLNDPNLSGIQIDVVGDSSGLTGLGVNNNAVYTPGLDGIQIEVSGVSSFIDNATVSGNTVFNTGGFGVQVNCGLNQATITNIDISGNTIQATTTAGVRVICADTNAQIINCGISNNRISTPGAAGIYVNQTVGGASPTGGYFPGLSIQGNSIYKSTGAGIQLESIVAGIITGVSITDNVIKEAGGNGITIDVLGGIMSYIQIMDNECWNATQNGIGVLFVTGLLSNFQVHGNHIVSPGTNSGVLSQGQGIIFTGDGTLISTSCNGNTITEPGTIGIGIGSVDTSAPGTPNIAGVQCNDNIITLAAEAGIVMVTAGGSGGLSNVVMNDNIITRPGTNGVTVGALALRGAGIVIAAITGATLRASSFENFVFDGNTIRWDDGDSGAGVFACGITLWSDNSPLHNVRISNCEIDKSPSSPVSIVLGDRASNIHVSDSKLISQATAVAAPNGFNIIVLDNPPDNVSIIGVNTGTGTLLLSGDYMNDIYPGDTIEILGSTGNDGQYVVASTVLNAGNTEVVMAAGTLPDGTVDGTVDKVVVHQNLTVANCHIVCPGSSTSAAVLLTSAVLGGVGTGNTGKFRNVTVVNNTIEDSYAGLVFQTTKGASGTYPGTDPILESFKVTGNTFRNIATVGIASLASTNARLVGPANALWDVLRAENLDFSGNEFHQCVGDPNTVLGLDWPWSSINIKINDNHFLGCGSASGNPQSTVFFGGGNGFNTSEDAGVQNLSLCGNVFQDCLGAALITTTSVLATADLPVRNVVVAKNQIFGGGLNYAGIGVFYSTFTIGADANLVRGIHINDNLVDGSTTGNAIAFYAESGDNIHICRNTVRNIKAAAIVASFTSAPSDVFNLSIKDNAVSQVFAEGIVVNTPNTAEIQNVQITGNEVRNYDQDAGSAPAIDFNQNGPLRNILIAHNSVFHTTTNRGVMLSVFLASSSSDEVSNVQVVHNTLQGPGTGTVLPLLDAPAMGISTAISCTGSNLNFSHNTAHGCGRGLSLTASGGTVDGLTICHNIIRNSGSFIIVPSGGAVVIDGDTTAPGARWTGIWEGLVMGGNITENGTVVSGGRQANQTFNEAYTQFGGVKTNSANLQGI